jgi:hypothetical protein
MNINKKRFAQIWLYSFVISTLVIACFSFFSTTLILISMAPLVAAILSLKTLRHLTVVRKREAVFMSAAINLGFLTHLIILLSCDRPLKLLGRLDLPSNTFSKIGSCFASYGATVSLGVLMGLFPAFLACSLMLYFRRSPHGSVQ